MMNYEPDWDGERIADEMHEFGFLNPTLSPKKTRMLMRYLQMLIRTERDAAIQSHTDRASMMRDFRK